MKINTLEVGDVVFFESKDTYRYIVKQEAEGYYLHGIDIDNGEILRDVLGSYESIKRFFLHNINYIKDGLFPYVNTLEDLTKIYVELQKLCGKDLEYGGFDIEFTYKPSLYHKYNYATYKDYIKYTYFITEESRFKHGDMVIYGDMPCDVLSYNSINKNYCLRSLIMNQRHYTKEKNITFNNRTMKKNLNGIEINIEYDDNKILIEADNYRSFRADYFGTAEEFFEENKQLVYKWFEKQIEKKADNTLNRLRDKLKDTKKELKGLVLPRTKEVLLAKTIDIIKEGVTDIAELYEEPSIKKQILNLFNKDR